MKGSVTHTLTGSETKTDSHVVAEVSASSVALQMLNRNVRTIGSTGVLLKVKKTGLFARRFQTKLNHSPDKCENADRMK